MSENLIHKKNEILNGGKTKSTMNKTGTQKRKRFGARIDRVAGGAVQPEECRAFERRARHRYGRGRSERPVRNSAGDGQFHEAGETGELQAVFEVSGLVAVLEP